MICGGTDCANVSPRPGILSKDDEVMLPLLLLKKRTVEIGRLALAELDVLQKDWTSRGRREKR